MTSALVVLDAEPGAPALQADLEAAGIHVLGACGCDTLVREALRLGAELLVCWTAHPDERLFRALETLRTTEARPVLVFTSDAAVEPMQRALQCGVHAWVVQGYAPARLRPLLQLAQARFRHERALRDELDELGHRFTERKLVDRAKGILMLARQVSEEEAFRLLRAGAMQSKQRIGQVAQQLIDAAQEAAGVNRAGQLRMLSQRLVKLYALQVARCEVPAAKALQAAAVEQMAERIEQLGRLLSRPTFGDLLEGVLQAWAPLERSLGAAPQAAQLLHLDREAEALLCAADRLTTALEHAGAAPSLRIINLAGRQRMLSQRCAKEALLGALLDEPVAAAARTAAAATAQEAAQALSELQAAPLSAPDIRESLAAAATAWPLMTAALDAAATPEGRQVLAQTSESLLAGFERLTAQIERSMQALTG